MAYQEKLESAARYNKVGYFISIEMDMPRRIKINYQRIAEIALENGKLEIYGVIRGDVTDWNRLLDAAIHSRDTHTLWYILHDIPKKHYNPDWPHLYAVAKSIDCRDMVEFIYSKAPKGMLLPPKPEPGFMAKLAWVFHH